MRNALQPQHPIQDNATASFGRVAGSFPRTATIAGDLPSHSANDDEFARRDAGEATTPLTLAANGFDETAQLRSGRYRSLGAAELNAAARADRSQRLGAFLVAAAGAAFGGLRQRLARFDRWRRERATVLALHELSDHTLRDLGLHRSEITSFAREIEHPASATRARLAQTLHR